MGYELRVGAAPRHLTHVSAARTGVGESMVGTA